MAAAEPVLRTVEKREAEKEREKVCMDNTSDPDSYGQSCFPLCDSSRRTLSHSLAVTLVALGLHGMRPTSSPQHQQILHTPQIPPLLPKN